ncbi:MAG: hypothetical protein K5888_10550 [Lachnospiraceae bacterium]|nr:hypothetical protein [Lachnospiraceae bacterium]
MNDRELDAITEEACNILNRLRTEPLVNFSIDDLTLAFVYMDAQGLFTSYLRSVFKGRGERWRQETWTDTSGHERPVYSHLFHANSVRTSIDYIRRKELYSRAFGEGGTQTVQNSDELDQRLMIYNDIFFDNSDTPHTCGLQTNPYGPIMFVFDVDILKKRDIRIFKVNPVVFKDSINTVKYPDLFFMTRDDIKDGLKERGTRMFLLNPQHHTTVFNTAELPFGDHLKAIYIEKYDETGGRENMVAERIRSELDAVGLNNVEIAIRPNVPVRRNIYAASREDLWRLP